MVLTKQNTGKYLTKEWNDPNRERQQCLYDSRQFSATEREYYEVTDTGIFDGKYYQVDEFCKIETSPVDTNTEPKPFDIRKKPEVGY